MTESNEIVDNRLHMRLKRHLLKHGKRLHHHLMKHGKRLHAHITRHRRKYMFGTTLYGISHLVILKVLGLKLLALKLVTGGLAFFGIMNPSLSDIFAKMENICIADHPIIAQQVCEKNFATIQDAVGYLESMIDPETDTIYSAKYYGIIKSLLGTYCDKQIDKDIVTTETKNINNINKQDSSERLSMLRASYDTRKKKSLGNDLGDEKEFCDAKYLAYDMLDLSQSLFLKELKKQGLLSPTPITSGKKNNKTDAIIISAFAQRKQDPKDNGIKYILEDLGNSSTNDMAHIIKNISINAIDTAINGLYTMKMITDKDKSAIKSGLEIGFVKSCDNNKGYHKINQYLGDNDIVEDTVLEKIRLDISLCDSYQYIDQLDVQVKKLLIHELGHYMYYFKDTSATTFENICRSDDGKKTTNRCMSDGFVSTYAQTNKEEDYAETFSRWTLTKTNKDNQYLLYYRELSPTTTSTNNHGSANDNVLYKKFRYFDSLLAKTAGK